MSQQNNTRFKVVFLVVLEFLLIRAYRLLIAKKQANRPSYLNQNLEPVPYFDCIGALLRSNEDKEEKQPQATATSISTHKFASLSWLAQILAPFIFKTNTAATTIEEFFYLRNSNCFYRNNLIVVSNLGWNSLSKQLLNMSL